MVCRNSVALVQRYLHFPLPCTNVAMSLQVFELKGGAAETKPTPTVIGDNASRRPSCANCATKRKLQSVLARSNTIKLAASFIYVAQLRQPIAAPLQPSALDISSFCGRFAGDLLCHSLSLGIRGLPWGQNRMPHPAAADDTLDRQAGSRSAAVNL